MALSQKPYDNRCVLCTSFSYLCAPIPILPNLLLVLLLLLLNANEFIPGDSVLQCKTEQYNTVQYNTEQYNTVQ